MVNILKNELQFTGKLGDTVDGCGFWVGGYLVVCSGQFAICSLQDCGLLSVARL